MLNPETIKKDFPIFENQPDLVYLDSAATALKPAVVLEAMDDYYRNYSANISRGLYPIAERATTAFEKARATIAHFLQAERVIFTANATQAINLVALGLEEIITPAHNLVVTALEHHSNYLPWKELAKRRGATLRMAPFTEEGFIDTQALLALVDQETTLIAFSAVSNVFGVKNPVAQIIRSLRQKYPQILILVDACQAIGHSPVNLSTWDADFVVFSGHKVFGPTGIGVLAGKHASLKLLTPKNVGGGTVLDACASETSYKELPENLEGGTPNIAGAIGLGAALEYIDRLGVENIHTHEMTLVKILIKRLTDTFGNKIHILGTEDEQMRAGLVSFTQDGIHPHDVAQILGEHNICVRAGEHCAAPLHRALKLGATTRVSFSVYNNEHAIEKLIVGMQKAITILG